LRAASAVLSDEPSSMTRLSMLVMPSIFSL
jgi:hypothetical protein